MNKVALQEFIKVILESILAEEPETDDAPFGRYAFDNARKDVPQQNKQQNTPQEEEAQEALKDYVGNNQKEKLAAIAPLMLDLVRKGMYQPILDAHSVPFVYRILQVPQNLATQLTGQQISGQQPAGLGKGGTLKPHDSNVSGWTSNVNLVKDFQGIGDGNTMLLFRAPTNGNNFFGKPGQLAVVAGEPQFAKEMETIGVGPINYDRVAYVMLYDDEQGYFDAQEAFVKLIELIQS